MRLRRHFSISDVPLTHSPSSNPIHRCGTEPEQAEGALATAKSQYAGQQFAAEIARKNFTALLEQAQAQLANAKANLTKAQADYDRQRSLYRPATSQQEVDAVTAALKQTQVLEAGN